jgi:hypothetical protein
MKPVIISGKPIKKLTAHDLAFGIGRKATKAELDELLSRPTGKGKDVEQVRKEIKENLKQKRDKRKAS